MPNVAPRSTASRRCALLLAGLALAGASLIALGTIPDLPRHEADSAAL